VGRYLLVEVLGVHATSAVYDAYDPELKRRVSLELLRTGRAGMDVEQERAQLLREAQARARVAHANVVAIYDVGTFDQHVFLAMERVGTQTLREWLMAAPRAWREVLAAFVAAGRGLAAAHEVGVVHGDFEPGQVRLGPDGRVHVTGFRLARRGPSAHDAASRVDRVRGWGLPASDAVPPPPALGRGQGAPLSGPRVDQLAFCVTLHEALYGAQPAAGAPPSEQGAVASPRSRAPMWPRRLLLRGLCADAPEGFASLSALLDALERGGGRRWRRGLLAAGGVALVAACVGLTHVLHTSASWACAGAREELASIWGPEQKAAVQASFATTGRPYATVAWERVRRELDAYVDAWVGARVDTCLATRGRSARSEEEQGKRMRCLDSRLADISALTALLAQADAKTVDEAHRATTGLPPIAGCLGQGAHGDAREPADAQTRERLRSVMARGRALLATGRYAEGIALIEPEARAIQAAGNRHEGAEVSLLLGELLEGAGKWREAETALFDALDVAEATRQDVISTRAWILLVRVSCIGLDEYELAARWKDRAVAALERLGPGHELSRIQLLTYTGTLLRMQRHFEEALATQTQALTLAEATFGPDSLEVADVLLELGLTHWRNLRPAESRVHLERGAAITERALGADHPEAAYRRQAVVPVLWLRASEPHLAYDDPAKLREDLEFGVRTSLETLAKLERTLGPEHPRIYDVLNELASTLMLSGRVSEALPYFSRALRVVEKSDGARSHGASTVRLNLGVLHYKQGNWAAAVEQLGEAVAIREELYGPRSAVITPALRHIGHALIQLRRHDEGLAVLHRVVDIEFGQPSDVNARWILALSALGQGYLDCHRPLEAIAPLERAVSGLPQARAAPGHRTQARFLLGQALWKSGKDRPRALRLVAEAKQMASSDGAWQELRENIDAWLLHPKKR